MLQNNAVAARANGRAALEILTMPDKDDETESDRTIVPISFSLFPNSDYPPMPVFHGFT